MRKDTIVMIASVCVGLSASLVLYGCSRPVARPAQEMTPRDFLANGLRYKRMGRIAESRRMLKSCIESDPTGDVALEARHVLLTQLPRQLVSEEAEQRNIIGYNQLLKGDAKTARTTFEKLIHDFPNFEWPYNNLALLDLQEGRLDDAESLLVKVTTINPNYGNAWATLLNVRKARGDRRGVQQCVQRLIELQNRAEQNKAEPAAEENYSADRLGI